MIFCFRYASPTFPMTFSFFVITLPKSINDRYGLIWRSPLCNFNLGLPILFFTIDFYFLESIIIPFFMHTPTANE